MNENIVVGLKKVHSVAEYVLLFCVFRYIFSFSLMHIYIILHITAMDGNKVRGQ